MKHIVYLNEKLLEHGLSEFSAGFECGLVYSNASTSFMADVTCQIIISKEYHKLKNYTS